MLDLAMLGVDFPLPDDCELPVGLMPKDYLEFKREFERNGPPTFRKLVRRSKLLVRVIVVGVSRNEKDRTTLASCKVVEVFKGSPLQTLNVEFGPWSSVAEESEYLLLPKSFSPNGWHVWGDSLKMQITFLDGHKVALATERDAEYWEELPIQSTQTRIAIDWNLLRDWLITAAHNN
jgi:hypothetical protein